MAVHEYLLDEPGQEWKEENPNRKGYFTKRLANGWDGGPDGHVGKPKEGESAPPHFHDVAQFQLSLEGSITFPGHPLEAIGVYYTDPYTAYGPFVTGPDHFRAVLRPGPAGHSLDKGIVWMSDREKRKLRNPRGREYYGQSKEAQWEDLTGSLAGARRQVLFGKDNEEGPGAQIWECPPNMTIQQNAAPFGEYHIILKGSAQWGNQEMKPYSMRYVVGDESPTALTAGPEGATWLILNYDQAAELKSPTGTPVQIP